jgi:hypothetical protein
MTTEGASTTANRIRFHDGWDTRCLYPVSDNSYALVTIQSSGSGSSLTAVYDSDEFYPTRTIDWDKDLGIARVQLGYNWDAASSQWPDMHQATDQTSNPWTDLNYHYDRFSDATMGTSGSATTFPSGTIDRLDQTTYRPLDGWFVMGDWTGKSFTQNGVQRLPSISRSSIQSNGVTQSETIGGTITKQYAYPSDNTGVPSSLTLTGTGLPGSGQVGFSYGYDPTYNLTSMTARRGPARAPATRTRRRGPTP